MILAVGQGIFGFGFIVTADAALTYLNDCYPDVCATSQLRWLYS